MTSYITDGTVGPWAKDKLECLSKYLHAYTTILNTQNWCTGFIYVDAFAGAGKALLRKYENDTPDEIPLLKVAEFVREEEKEAEIYIHGSPRVALDLDKPFTEYIFIEKDSSRIDELEQLKAKYGEKRTITILQGDANAKIQESLLEEGRYNWKKYRGVVFLDPFGMQVPWGTIEAIGKTQGLELILNLPVGTAIQRLLPRSGKFDDLQKTKLDEYFGSAEWRNIVYEEASDLFGTQITKRHDTGKLLAKWYQKRLKRVYGFSSRPRLFKNTRGTHLYYLLWAGPKKTGSKIASDVFKQGEIV